jgi:hypothetical protein
LKKPFFHYKHTLVEESVHGSLRLIYSIIHFYWNGNNTQFFFQNSFFTIKLHKMTHYGLREVALCRRIRKNHQRTEVIRPVRWRQKPTFLSIPWNYTPTDTAWFARRRELAATPPRELQISIYVPSSFFHIGNYTFTSERKTVLLSYIFPAITHIDMFVTKPSRRKKYFNFHNSIFIIKLQSLLHVSALLLAIIRCYIKNIMRTNTTRGSQKVRFPILLPPNNFT